MIGDIGFSINRGTPKWLVYNGKSENNMNDLLGYPHFRKPPYIPILPNCCHFINQHHHQSLTVTFSWFVTIYASSKLPNTYKNISIYPELHYHHYQGLYSLTRTLQLAGAPIHRVEEENNVLTCDSWDQRVPISLEYTSANISANMI